MSILSYLFKHGSKLLSLLSRGNTPGGSHLIIELLNNNKATLERMLPELKQDNLFDDTVAVLQEQITAAPVATTMTASGDYIPNVGA